MTTSARALAGQPTLPRGWWGIGFEMAAGLAALAREMSFVEHLEELRRRLIWSVLSIAGAFVLCWTFNTELLDLASAPIRANPAVTLSVSRVQDVFSLNVKVTLVAAVFLATPFVFAQAWLFIAPGLYPHERRYAVPFVLFSSALFLCGGAFGYFAAFPMALEYLLSWTVESRLVPIIDAGEYFNLFFTIVVALGLAFQIPAVVFVLSRIGIVDASFLLAKSKYAMFLCVIAAAVITPTTDPGNMFAIAGPMIALYGLGIVVAWIFGKPRRLPA